MSVEFARHAIRTSYLEDYKANCCARGKKMPSGGGDGKKYMGSEDEEDQNECGYGRPSHAIHYILQA